MKLNLADKELKSKTKLKSHSYWVTDTIQPRLLLKVQTSGRRVFHWSQGYVDGIRKRPKLAKYEDTTASIMRADVDKKNKLMSQDINPFATDLQRLTLGMFLIDIYMPKQEPTIAKDGTKLGLSEKEYKNRLSMINAHIKDGIGKVLLKDMSYPTVSKFLDKLALHSPTQCKNVRFFLIAAWKEALRQHSQNLRLPNFFEMWDIKTLSKRIKHNQKPPRPLDQDLGEGVALYNAIEKVIETSPLIARCIKLQTLLVIRKMHCAGLKFDDIKKDAKTKQSYVEKVFKNEKIPIYFGESSLALLAEIKDQHKKLGLVKFKYLFPRFKNGRYVDEHISDDNIKQVYEGRGHGKAGANSILGIASKTAPTLLGTKDIPKFTLHDLRDTADQQTDNEDSQYALGHKNAQTSERSYRAIEKTKMSAVADKREKAMQEILKSE